MRGFTGLVVAAALFASGAQAPLAGQVVRGEVVEVGVGTPIVAVFVTLIEEGGERRVSVLTGADGRFVLRAPGPGRYTLLVERIGYVADHSPVFELTPEQLLARRIEIAVQAIDLEALEVEIEAGACSLPIDLARETYRLWDEARRALELAVWTSESGDPPFQSVVFQRSRDVVTLGILAEQPHERRLVSGTGRTPFTSASLEVLRTHGFIQREGGGTYTYFGLDAATLLSDFFLESHCFRAVAGNDGDGTRIGLGFQPIPGIALPDVKGVLWLDRETLELRTLEFEYTRHLHAFDLPEERFGGQVSFRMLSNGAWIVNRWSLRMPDLASIREGEEELSFFTPRRPASTPRERLEEASRRGIVVREEGGNVHFMAAPSGDEDAGGARLEGTVTTAERGAPLSGATVFLTGGQHVTTTGSDGRFSLADLPEGTHQVAFFHPYTDRLGLALAPVEVELSGGVTSTIALAVPSVVACLPSDDPDAPPTGGLSGFVLDRESGEPRPGATVEISWSDRRDTSFWEAVRGLNSQENHTEEVVADSNGRYFACGVPMGALARARVDGNEASDVEIEVDIPAAIRLDLFGR